jgi:tetratricopeptide (TPR) repeat protein
MRYDRRGVAVTASTAAAVIRFDDAVASFLAHRADTLERVAAALAADDDLVLGHCLCGFLQLLLGRAELFPKARQALKRALASLAQRGGTPRERALTAALDAWCGGEMELSAAILEASLARHPLDAVTVKLLHNLRFMLGDAAGMRRSLESVLPAWTEETPEFGFVLGCHAFALEESGTLDAAEAAGKRALALAPQDVWGCHAVAHVHERRGEPAQGLAWLSAHEGKWDEVNNFARHLAWHEALYRLARNEIDAVFALYDRAIRAARSDDFRDVSNAAGLLHRLERAGHEVGRRWDELADIAERRSRDHALVFARLHYLLCLIGAGRSDAAYRSFAAMDIEARAGSGSQARLLARLGVPLAKILLAEGHPATALAVPALRARLTGLGGSQAQREIFRRMLDAAEAQPQRSRAVA